MNKIKELIEQEKQRQENEICLIASENYASKNILNACGNCVQNKYSEGKPNIKPLEHSNNPYFWYEYCNYQRYYAGCEYVDKIEIEAIKGVCKAFNTRYANVQSHSGSSANLQVYSSICKYWNIKPNELNLYGFSLNSMGHLTHGSNPSISGQWFNAEQLEIGEDGYIDYNIFEDKLRNQYPYKVFVIGFSAYPRQIDYSKIAKIFKNNCKEETFILFDTSHISGLIVAGLHQNPMDYDYGKAIPVLSSTTHKTLRMARHAIITTNNYKLAKCVDSAVFPFTQGGALQNMIAGIAIGFQEALQPSFKQYQTQVLANIKAMEKVFKEREVKMVTDGSDVHLLLLDLKEENFSGAQLESLLEKIGIITNKNSVKGDTRPKMETSGLRIGTAAVTTRGANEYDCKWFAHLICNCIEILRGTFDYEGSGLLRVKDDGNIDYDADIKQLVIEDMKQKVKRWCETNPIYAE